MRSPKRVISRFEFLLGGNFIYATGPEYFREMRVGKLGFRSTLGLMHDVNERFELDLKLSYEVKGLKFRVYSENPGPSPMNEHVSDVTLNYGTASFMGRWSVLPGRKLQVGLGPYFGYLINMKLMQKNYYNNVLVSRYSNRPDPNISYNEFDSGISIMTASNFLLTNGKSLTVQLLYSRGLIDINKPTIDRLRNNVFSLVMGYSINRNGTNINN